MRRSLRLSTAFVMTFASAAALAAPQPIDAFARRPQMQGVTISADGRYVAFLSGSGDDTTLMTFDRSQPGAAFRRVTASEPNKFDIGWCRFANKKRVLCGLYGNIRGKKYAESPFRKLFAVDADGTALKSLETPRDEANPFKPTTSARNFNMNYGASVEKSNQSQYAMSVNDAWALGIARAFNRYSPAKQDAVIDFTPEDDDTVLIETDDDRNGVSSVTQLNIYTGFRTVKLADTSPIQHFLADSHGNVRVGWGNEDVKTVYFQRPQGEKEWRRLASTQSFSDRNPLRPVAMAAGSNSAYALGNFEGRDALWSIDLADKREPQLLFKHPLVDVSEPLLQSDRRLLGVRYDVERPYVWYADPKLNDLIKRLEEQFPNRAHEIVDATEDLKTLVIQSSSDNDAGTYYVYDVEKEKLQKLGTAYPELAPTSIGMMTNIIYKATDGTEIPGYLTVPSGAERKNLPLIVMPHDGPNSRDSWKFDYLRNFLANRGYAVLQPNYRGSDGFGQKWFMDGRQQWGGLTYTDIQDATKWAVSEGIADPKKICIVGTGFGGYEALLSVARTTGVYACAVSINGITDLVSYQEQGVVTGEKEFRRLQIGSEKDALKRDSPAANAEKIDVPVLLVHGTKDWVVQMDQTKAMEDALDRAGKDVTVLMIKNAGHELERKSDRVALLTQLETFLKDMLAP